MDDRIVRASKKRRTTKATKPRTKRTTRSLDLRKVSILDAMQDVRLFGKQFGNESWDAWRVFLRALFSKLSAQKLETYRKHTGRESAAASVKEAWVIVGRRGGKSRIAGLCAVFLALFKDYSGVLAPGEVGTVMVLAADRQQARTVFRYIGALVKTVPELAAMVETERTESIDFKHGVSIEVATANYRTVRGYTVLAAICDEVAFWRSDESANPDTEILNALRPAMATVPHSLLIAISTPYGKRGEVWNAYDRFYGQDGDVLVWQADTRAMNPTVAPAVIERAYEQDPVAAAAEYGAQFRQDVEAFLTPEAVEAVTVSGRYELPKESNCSYFAFTDPSGGARDSFSLAIAHLEGEKAVLDVIRERRPPFSPDAVATEYAELVKAYGLHRVTGDRYAGEWPREAFRKCGVEYVPSDRDKSAIYGAVLPAINSRRVDLLDSRVLKVQLLGLERRTARSGKDSIDHAPGARDDVANAVAGALVGVVTDSSRVAVVCRFYPTGSGGVVLEDIDPHDTGLWRWPSQHDV